MQLIDGHRRAQGIALCARGEEFAVLPLPALDVPDLAARGGAGLGVEGEGVGLEHGVAALVHDAVFVDVALLDAGDEGAPDAVLAAVHGVGGAVPAVEVADDRDLARVGGPYHEAVHVAAGYVAAAKGEISHARAAGVEEIDVIVGNVFFCEFSLIHQITSDRKSMVMAWPPFFASSHYTIFSPRIKVFFRKTGF